MPDVKDNEVVVVWGEPSGKWIPADWTGAVSGRIALRKETEAQQILGRRSHDVTAGLRTLRFAIDSLKDGYRFDDKMAEAKITAMEKAITNLERETALLTTILGSVFQP